MPTTIVSISATPKVYRLTKLPPELHKKVTVVFGAALLDGETISSVVIDDAGTGIVAASVAVGQSVELDLLGGNGGEQILMTVTATGSAGSIRQALLLLSIVDPVTMLATEPIIPVQRAVTYQGTWAAEAAYLRGDVVHYGPDSWLALRPNTGVTPTPGDDWVILTSVTEAENARQATFEAAEVDRNAAQAVREAALQAKADQVMTINPSGAYYTVGALDNLLNIMTRAEFEAMANKRRNIYAGSGFVEWGRHNTNGSNINEGLFYWSGGANTWYMGKVSGQAASGVSRTHWPVANVNGYLLRIDRNTGADATVFTMPPAPATSALLDRQDLVFLEVWHEDVSEKDFVYPFGNVQYGATTYTKPDGTTIATVNGAFSGFGTYSLFGNWQASSALIGRGMVWSTMTDANKRAFVSDPENNMYLDGTKIIQVRYRIRVVEGVGSSWQQVNPQGAGSSMSKVLAYNNSNIVSAKGKATSIPSDLTAYSSLVSFITSNSTDSPRPVSPTGAFASENVTATTYTATLGQLYALPIALVHRRNQGAFHPVWNPNGTARCLNIDGTTGALWYSTDRAYTSAADCFSFKNSGLIGGTSGRPDGLFYDEINERDVRDLRNSAWVVDDLGRCLEREFNKLVAGTVRGWGKAGVTKPLTFTADFAVQQGTGAGGASCTQLVSNTLWPITYGDATKINDENVFSARVKDNAGLWRVAYALVNGSKGNVWLHPMYGNITGSFSAGQTYSIQLTINQPFASKTLLACDIIGDPANYPQSWKDNGVMGTPLLVAEDGTSLLPTGSLSSFKLSRKANATPVLVLRSTNQGATWASVTPTFSTTTNALTLTNEPAANIVMVFYLTEASPFELATNAEVLVQAAPLASFSSSITTGAGLVSALINKIGVIAGAPFVTRKPLTSFNFASNPNPPKFTTFSSEGFPEHTALTAGVFITGTPAVKALPYLTRANGKLYLQCLYKEMRHNGTSWGDDAKFNVVDNESTVTDNNALTVKVGQRRLELPFFIRDGR